MIATAALLIAGYAATALAEVAIPPLRARVTDLTGTLNQKQQSALEQKLAQFEAQKGAQIGILVLSSTKPEEIEQFAVRVQEVWQLGRAGVDDGVLLVVAKDDRAVRIEVGYGLEGVLPDAIAKRIIEDDIIPWFRNGDFYAGIDAGLTRVIGVIEGEPLPPPRRKTVSQARTGLDWLFPAFVLLLIGRRLLTAVFGRFGGASLSGAILGMIAWIVVGSLFIALLVGVLVFAFSLSTGIPGGRFYRPSGGGWSAGRGGSLRGGWSSGGFGGGGGLSGGGGASGRW